MGTIADRPDRKPRRSRNGSNDQEPNAELILWARRQVYQGAAKAVLNALASRADADRRCQVSQYTLARDTGLHLATVKRAIARLVADGVVTVLHRSRFQNRRGKKGRVVPNTYQINAPYATSTNAPHRAHVLAAMRPMPPAETSLIGRTMRSPGTGTVGAGPGGPSRAGQGQEDEIDELDAARAELAKVGISPAKQSAGNRTVPRSAVRRAEREAAVAEAEARRLEAAELRAKAVELNPDGFARALETVKRHGGGAFHDPGLWRYELAKEGVEV